ncbi:uncharacterized protein [Physcomitrium patens]|uniref:MOSC domain-containing protein n=1 Tax=Physcomitrium patens TaxID=3218 RepID=A0A2K1IU42_PHYPA|nr:mitochondrial amidoxime reducing component 2-like [Physcomitrium patens]PNR32778.1 hypothetical protein PHYPA_024720 [Physcomitrium patens]|eukprot:XP_024358440.1 mitochondrial amidoxime reducing component 2-like [Physcomitrella patens]
METRVKALYIYPVKSCRGIAVPHASITPTGFKWDRQWLIVNANGLLLTQRAVKKLALVEAILPEEALDSRWGSISPDAALCLKAPGMEPLYVPLVPQYPLKKVENITCWEWSGTALSEGDEAAQWFTKYLGKPSSLVRFDNENVTRPTDPDFAVGHKVAFSDGFPFLLISQASLDALNKKLSVSIPIDRFRPNIFVDGCEAFAEDEWGDFKIGDFHFHGVKLCGRCTVPTINQQTGEASKEPTLTLRSFRKGSLLHIPTMENEVFFGQNVTCEDAGLPVYGTAPALKIGDVVKILKTVSILEIMS